MEVAAMLARLVGIKPEVSRVPMVEPNPTFPLDRMERFQNMAIAVGLKALFSSRRFYVSDLRKLLDAAGIIPDGRVMRTLDVLHCVAYEDMPKPLRDEVFRVVLAMFEEPPHGDD